ncbi:AraC family transcriptional regulator [Actinomadura opuntiae]|uniref:AraC family transcriptional regulator n=1 Tax=Actinomadura sp. OS1-43 TaxID=604315 RepID=UPI00255A7D6E|nr:AraC family transcriptional regulator [Actinomadura sp. OS1-43]MDL4816411.1 AraC family transcriptional regulator [Actinomadura sp. OS1-43]
MSAAATWWRLRGLDGLELMRAHFVRHAFSRHGHETFAIGVVQSGAEDIWFRDGTERVGPGGLVFIHPEEIHTGTAPDRGGWHYRVLYPAAEVMAGLAGTRGTPRFRERVVYAADLADRFVEAHAATETEDALTAETLTRLALATLLRGYGAARAPRSARSPKGPHTTRAREILHTRMADPPGLDELAAEVGVGPFTLLRSFRDAYGLPPHALLIQLRVLAARRLLERRVPPSGVATAVGFFDQAHLTRHFRRAVGVPPGAYQRAVGAQDRTSRPTH